MAGPYNISQPTVSRIVAAHRIAPAPRHAEGKFLMAGSGKPSRKSASAAGTKAPAGPVLPDRRAMEAFLAKIVGPGQDDALEKAQEVIHDAWEKTTSKSRGPRP